MVETLVTFYSYSSAPEGIFSAANPAFLPLKIAHAKPVFWPQSVGGGPRSPRRFKPAKHGFVNVALYNRLGSPQTAIGRVLVGAPNPANRPHRSAVSPETRAPNLNTSSP